MTTTIAVLGAGAWGTALAIQAARAGRSVTLWARDAGRVPRRSPRRGRMRATCRASRCPMR